MKGVPINFLQYDSEEEFIQTGYLLFHTVGLIMDVAEKYHVPTDTVIDVITESIIDKVALKSGKTFEDLKTEYEIQKARELWE